MAGSIPENGLPKELIDGLWEPSFLPEEVNLNEFIQDEVVDQEIVQQSLESKQANVLTGVTAGVDDVPIPLTEAEAAEADRQIDATLSRIDATLGRISATRGLINQVAGTGSGTSSGTSGGELSFTLDISKKRRIRRAVKRIFGIKTDEITYSMYIDAIEARRLLENQEATGYVKGFDDNDDEEDE